MIDAYLLSIIAAVCLVAFLIAQRRLIFSWSAIGVFWITNLVFVYIGVLVFPWIQHTILGQGVWFPGVNFAMIRDKDIQWAIVLTIGGGMMVLFFYRYAHLLSGTGKVLRAPFFLLSPATRSMTHGFLTRRLLIFSVLMLFCACAYTIMNLSDFVAGIRLGLLGGDPEMVFQARRETLSNYLYVLLVYNVIPFIGVAMWLRFYPEETGKLKKYYIYFYNFCACVFLVLTFQKRPLFVFLISLLLAYFWIHSKFRIGRKSWIGNKSWRSLVRKKVIIYGGVLFIILVILYFLHTQAGRRGESFFEAIELLAEIALVRIFGRLSIQPVMYVHYFPDVDPYYGFTNIKLFADIFGFQHYQGNALIFEYFRNQEGGHIAISALMDFYGAFGMAGWALGTMMLGIMLYWMDVTLARLKPNACNICLTIYSFVFVYYLSQASLARSLMGYGGLIFVALWWLLKTTPHSTSMRQNQVS
jgi:hypothetical protein